MFSAPATTAEPVNLSANGLRISAASAKCATTASISTLHQLACHARTKRPAAALSIACLPMPRFPPCELIRRLTWQVTHVNYVDVKGSVVLGDGPHDGHPCGSSGLANAVERRAQYLALM